MYTRIPIVDNNIPSTNARVPSIFLPTCQKQKSVREILRRYVVVRSWWHKKVTSFTCLVKYGFFPPVLLFMFSVLKLHPCRTSVTGLLLQFGEKNTFIISVRVYLLFSACTRVELIYTYIGTRIIVTTHSPWSFAPLYLTYGSIEVIKVFYIPN